MPSEPIIFTIFLIFAGAAILATLALYARLSLLIVYIGLGILLGPFGVNIVSDPQIIQGLSHIGIIFLLFLLGVNLQPQKLIHMLRESVYVTGASAMGFLGLGAGIALLFGYALTDSLVIGAAMMFSSTIIGLKLLPTTVLHHQHMGEIIISILLLQDILAILILMLLPADWANAFPLLEIFKLLGSLIGLILFAWAFARFVLFRLIARFDRIQEYIFLLAIGWCLSMAELAVMLGLSAEIGAFIGGIALATNPIALYIGESLKPLRDFFLVIFFFALGASFDLGIIEKVWLPASILAGTFMLIKPLSFKWLLRGYGEASGKSLEAGVRLGQISEFSLFIAVLALELKVISTEASYLIQVTTLLSFLVSSWFIVMRYPTPIATSDKLRRD
ncbi:cation:proton antiporter [Sulfuriflexus mobilis]|uniref:cation:proton antiporter n=1 Tax=Sulfuriflexus mobilis TaxID=1811807 RepID=UPI000F81B9A4|nr:cation:proton antiporter [Sulfuriflexus mobilis]